MKQETLVNYLQQSEEPSIFKKMVFVNLGAKVKELIWCEQMDYLTICLDKGTLINLQLDVQNQGTVLAEDEPEKTIRWMSKSGELKLEPKVLSQPDNVLFQFNYIQNQSDTPYLDVRVDSKDDAEVKCRLYKQKLSMYSVSTAKIHDKTLKCAACDQ